MYGKRMKVCLLGGVISACICLTGRQIIFGFPDITWANIAATVANRLLLGFTIGLSCWKLNHFLHGAVLGLILSASVSIGFIPDDVLAFFLYTSAGILYGIMIEWLSTDVFKAPMREERSSERQLSA
jgi:hypothetical protein